MLNVEIGQKLDGYHDGKRSPSRLVRIVVDDIIERRDLSRGARKLWREALKRDFNDAFDGCVEYFSCDESDSSTRQFWDWNCDTFIVGHIVGDAETDKDRILFAKRPDAFGWYGVNWNYALELDGCSRKKFIRHWRSCAKECGNRIVWNEKDGRYDYFDLKTGKKVED